MRSRERWAEIRKQSKLIRRDSEKGLGRVEGAVAVGVEVEADEDRVQGGEREEVGERVEREPGCEIGDSVCGLCLGLVCE